MNPETMPLAELLSMAFTPLQQVAIRRLLAETPSSVTRLRFPSDTSAVNNNNANEPSPLIVYQPVPRRPPFDQGNAAAFSFGTPRSSIPQPPPPWPTVDLTNGNVFSAPLQGAFPPALK